MIDLEHELRDFYASTDDDPEAADRIRASLAATRNRKPAVRTIAAAAAAAAGVVVAVAVVRTHSRPAPSAGAPAVSCTADLPAAWHRALRTTPITISGVPTHPIRLTSDGRAIVAWQPAGQYPQLGITALSGRTRTLMTATGTDLAGGYALEGDTLVVGPTGGATVIDVIDVQSGRMQHLATTSLVPRGYRVADGVAIQDGVVYFGASPRGDGRGGVIVGYDLASTSSRIVARTQAPVFVRQDARGVLWDGGGIRKAGTPGELPGTEVRNVYTDGADYAWNADWHTNRTVSWTGRTGTRSVDVTLPDDTQATPIVAAVSGPYVLLTPYAGFKSNPPGSDRLFVLDTRTGAVADLGVPVVDVSAATTPRFLAFTDAQDATLRIDTSRLPGLRC